MIQLISTVFVYFICLNVFENRIGLKKTFNSIFKLLFIYVDDPLLTCAHEFSTEFIRFFIHFVLVNIFHSQHCTHFQCIFICIITYEKFGSSWVKFVLSSHGNFIGIFQYQQIFFYRCRFFSVEFMSYTPILFARAAANAQKHEITGYEMETERRGGRE